MLGPLGSTVNEVSHITSRKMLYFRDIFVVILGDISLPSFMSFLSAPSIPSLPSHLPLPTDLTVDVALFSESEGLDLLAPTLLSHRPGTLVL